MAEKRSQITQSPTGSRLATSTTSSWRGQICMRTSLMNPRINLWLAFAATLFIPSVSHAETKPRIIVVTHGARQSADPFWSVVRNGVETATKETDTNVDYRSPETFDV